MTYELEYEGSVIYTNMEGLDNEYSAPSEESMPGFIMLDNIGAGKSGYLNLKVSLADDFEGKAMDYAADLGMSFALEAPQTEAVSHAVPAELQVMDQGILTASIVIVAAALFLLEIRGKSKKIIEQ